LTLLDTDSVTSASTASAILDQSYLALDRASGQDSPVPESWNPLSMPLPTRLATPISAACTPLCTPGLGHGSRSLLHTHHRSCLCSKGPRVVVPFFIPWGQKICPVSRISHTGPHPLQPTTHVEGQVCSCRL
jgi:hypothetical protein